jgi:predicted RNA-binding Zn-ribbon protein involved in translation (DUF1610 family)
MSTTTEKSYTPVLDKATCPSCANTHARRATRTLELVYLRCEECGYTWPIAERRKRASAPNSDGVMPED